MRSQIQLWDELKFIQQLRGVEIGRGPVGRTKQFGRLVFAQLVQAIRSAGTTSVAMEARGFSKKPESGKRTWAEPAIAGSLDGFVLLAAGVIALTTFLVG
jgi:energy-coupling factor transporter transmembrane protein EcfT